MLHGPCPAPAVRPATGAIKHVLAFASGFGITSSLALFSHFLWKFARLVPENGGSSGNGSLKPGKSAAGPQSVEERALDQLRQSSATSTEPFDLLTPHGHSMVLGWVTNDIGHAKRVLA